MLAFLTEKGTSAILAPTPAIQDRTGNRASMTGIFPDAAAVIVRSFDRKHEVGLDR